jgi:DNA polymerase (family 10)
MTRQEAFRLISRIAITATYCDKWEIVGSYKRGKASFHDLDILVACTQKGWMDLQSCMIEEKGATRKRGGDLLVTFDLEGKQIDFLRAEEHQWGSALCHHTGSAEENERLRTIAKEAGMKLNQYGIDDAGGNHHDFKTEEEVYAFLNQPYKRPEMR